MTQHLSASDTKTAHWRHDPRWAYMLVILATLFWAGNVILGRALRDQIGPFTLAAARVGIASLIFLLLMRRLPPAKRRPGRERPRLLGMALLGMVGCPVTLYLALRYTSAGSSAMITGTEPLVTALLAGCLLGTRLTSGQLGGAALSMLSVVFVTPALRFGASAGVGDETNGALNGLTLKRGDLIMLANVIM